MLLRFDILSILKWPYLGKVFLNQERKWQNYFNDFELLFMELE